MNALNRRQTQPDEVSRREVKLRLTPAHIRAVSTPMAVHHALDTGNRAREPGQVQRGATRPFLIAIMGD